MPEKAPAAWIAVDASSPQLRGWVMHDTRPKGAAHIALQDLNAYAALLPQGPVIVAGLSDAEVARVPAKPDAGALRALPVMDGRLYAVPGLEQTRPFGRLQGAETRVSGFLGLNPDWDGVICLPGENSHWVLVSAGEIVSFQSFTTWPLVQALCPPEVIDTKLDTDSIQERLQDVLSKPEQLATRIAETRAAWHAGRLTAAKTYGQIWGAALGAELAATRPYWLGQNLALIAPEALVGPYRIAFEAQALPITIADDTRMMLEGLCRASLRLSDGV